MRAMPHLPTPPDMPGAVKAIIDAIGHSVRTEILHQLSRRPQTVRELADATGTVVSQVRKHLAILEDLDLVRADRPSEERGPGRGRVVFWATNQERAKEVGRRWVDYVTGHHAPESTGDPEAN
jgi:DNA-binding transcriptional ArsR family regulator